MKTQGIKRILLLCGIALTVAMASNKFETTVCAEEYIYDDLNRVIMVKYDDGGTVEYIYDSNGNIIETIVLPAMKENSQEPEMNGNASKDSKESQTDSKNDGATDHTTTDNTVRDSDTAQESDKTTDIGKQGSTEKEFPLTETNDSILLQTEEIAAFIESIAQQITEYAKNTLAYL